MAQDVGPEFKPQYCKKKKNFTQAGICPLRLGTVALKLGTVILVASSVRASPTLELLTAGLE
jgi:hypothetical protein